VIEARHQARLPTRAHWATWKNVGVAIEELGCMETECNLETPRLQAVDHGCGRREYNHPQPTQRARVATEKVGMATVDGFEEVEAEPDTNCRRTLLSF